MAVIGARGFSRPLTPAESGLTRGFVLALTGLFACVLQVASAQESEQDSSEVIDEIVVEGQKSLSRLRHRMYAAEDDFYALFNSVNDDDDFDVKCIEEAPIGSRVKRRVCKANFELQATAEEARGVRLGIPAPSAISEVARKRDIFLEKMEVLVNENPRLLVALTNFGDAKSDYETEREKWCEGSLLSCSQQQ